MKLLEYLIDNKELIKELDNLLLLSKLQGYKVDEIRTIKGNQYIITLQLKKHNSFYRISFVLEDSKLTKISVGGNQIDALSIEDSETPEGNIQAIKQLLELI